MPQIYYFSGIKSLIDNHELSSACHKVLGDLYAGDTRRAKFDLKKSPKHRLYTARLNQSDRMLFTTVKDKDGKNYLYLLEIIENHDYQKSKFLNNPSLLTNLLEETFSSSESLGSIESWPEHEDSLVEMSKEATQLTPSYFIYNDKLTILNKQQEAATIALPSVITGPAGSGKTNVGMSILSKINITTQAEEKNHVAYITKLPHLAKHAQEQWEAQPQDIKRNSNIEFLTYNEAFFDESTEILDINHFKEWFQSVRKTSTTHQKNVDVIDLFKAKLSLEDIYQEMRICAVYHTSDEYQRILSAKDAVLPAKYRKLIYKVCEAYCRNFTAKKLNPDLYRMSADQLVNRFTHIILDEAQDLAPLQLKNAFTAANGKIAYCLDTHQSLFGFKSVLPYLIKLVGEERYFQLPHAYRSPNKILHLANTIIKIKFNLVGCTADKYELTEIIIPENNEHGDGEIYWFSETNCSAQVNELFARFKATEIAIITDEEYEDEAKHVFANRKVTILTPAKIKGLEYPVIMAYKVFAHETFQKASELIEQTGLKTITGRTTGKENSQYAFPCNRVFVTATRATQVLAIIQDVPKKLERLQQELFLGFNPLVTTVHASSSAVSSSSSSSSSVATTSATETTEADWIRSAIRLYKNNNTESAKQIFIEFLGKTEEEYNQFVLKFSSQRRRSGYQPPQVLTETKVETRPTLPTTQKSKSEKITNYVDGLIKKPTLANFEKLFSCTPKMIADVLLRSSKRDELLIKIADCSLPYKINFQTALINRLNAAATTDPQFIRNLFAEVENDQSKRSFFAMLILFTNFVSIEAIKVIAKYTNHKMITEQVLNITLGRINRDLLSSDYLCTLYDYGMECTTDDLLVPVTFNTMKAPYIVILAKHERFHMILKSIIASNPNILTQHCMTALIYKGHRYAPLFTLLTFSRPNSVADDIVFDLINQHADWFSTNLLNLPTNIETTTPVFDNLSIYQRLAVDPFLNFNPVMKKLVFSGSQKLALLIKKTPKSFTREMHLTHVHMMDSESLPIIYFHATTAYAREHILLPLIEQDVDCLPQDIFFNLFSHNNLFLMSIYGQLVTNFNKGGYEIIKSLIRQKPDYFSCIPEDTIIPVDVMSSMLEDEKGIELLHLILTSAQNESVNKSIRMCISHSPLGVNKLRESTSEYAKFIYLLLFAPAIDSQATSGLAADISVSGSASRLTFFAESGLNADENTNTGLAASVSQLKY